MRKGMGIAVAALLLLAACGGSVPKGFSVLVLDDPAWERVNVQVVITQNEDCEARGKGFISARSLVMRKGTPEKLNVPDGASLCWRHDRDPNHPTAGDWSGWSRATLFPGQKTETDL